MKKNRIWLLYSKLGITDKKRFAVIVSLIFAVNTLAQNEIKRELIISRDDYQFLESITRDVLESSRIYPGQKIASDYVNNTGGTLIRPGGRNAYPSFWIRDYAMSLECGFITPEEQKHMLRLTASTQCDQTWITSGGSMVPLGSIADHILIDNGKALYFPGSEKDQGNKRLGMFPPYCDQFYFIHMVYYYIKSTADIKILFSPMNGMRLIDRLEMAFKVPPTRKDDHIVYTTDDFRGVDFGFRDVIQITGDLCYPSLLKFQAANQLAELFEIINQKGKAEEYKTIGEKIKKAVPELFSDPRGMLFASTGKSKQPDVWGTALAVYLHVLDDEKMMKTCRFLADAYKNGWLAYEGNIRHVLTCDDYNDTTAWEASYAKKNTYQNGAYWGTPTGWVSYAIAKVEPELAQKLLGEYIDNLRKYDYRKGEKYGAPYECFHPLGEKRNAVYLTSVSCPYITLNK